LPFQGYTGHCQQSFSGKMANASKAVVRVIGAMCLLFCESSPSYALPSLNYLFKWAFVTDDGSTGGAGNIVEGLIELSEGLNSTGTSPVVTSTPTGDLLGGGWSLNFGSFNVVAGEIVSASAAYSRPDGQLLFAKIPPDPFYPQLSGGGIDFRNLTPGLSPTYERIRSPQVPGPLPVFGAAAAFGYSRKLRKRIARSKTVPVASAID
jgi:hypothetical protein